MKKKLLQKKDKKMEKGTKELGEVLKFVCALANGIGEAAKDGEPSIGDATNLIPMLYKLPAAVDGISELPAEAKDLSVEEMAALVAMVKDDLDLPQDKVEMAVEEGLELSLKLYSLVQKLRS